MPGVGASPQKPSPSGRGWGEGESPYNYELRIINYELGRGGRPDGESAGHWRKPLKSPPFAKGGLGGFYTYTYTSAYAYIPP